MHRKNLREKLEQYNPTDETEKADKVKMMDLTRQFLKWKQQRTYVRNFGDQVTDGN